LDIRGNIIQKGCHTCLGTGTLYIHRGLTARETIEVLKEVDRLSGDSS